MSEFNLVSGFLGSGKTSLIKNILDEYSGRKRIAVIQNEFAPSGIDGKELKNTGNDFHLTEINNGSVFCVCMLGNFVKSLEKLLKTYQPEMIFLEASGMSDPINIIELLQSENIRDKISLNHIFTIIDCPNFDRGFNTFTRFRHQIMVADHVLLNKTDLFKGDIKKLHEKIKELNPFTEINETTYGNIPEGIFLNEPANKSKAASRFVGQDSEGRPDIKTSVLRTNDRVSEENLQAFLSEIKPGSIRIKGYLNLDNGKVMAVQSVYEQMELKSIKNYQGPSELILFNDNISVRELRNIFKKYKSS